MNILRRYPLTLCCIALIWYLCLFKVPDNYSFPTFVGIDKVVHVVMYLGTCGTFWVEYFRSHTRMAFRPTLLGAVVAPILMSGLIELAQQYGTDYRSGDWMDFLANSCGVLLAYAGALLYQARFSHRK